jgi:hypothetical protein
MLVQDIRVSATSDDAEENSSGTVNLHHASIELVYDRNNQVVGIRFTKVQVPRGATILYAYVQFQSEGINSQATTLRITGQAVDNAQTFKNTKRNISSRERTQNSSLWAPLEWLVIDEAGDKQRTSDLSSIIQEIIDRSGWSAGNSMVIIFDGTGVRTAWSYDGRSSNAPVLHVEYLLP